MHEIRIAEDITAIVLETAKQERLSEVTKVNIVFGRMIRIVPETFEFAFREAVADSIAGKAQLSIEIIPVRLRCRQCETVFNMEKNFFKCRVCGSADPDIINGTELFIKSIEGE